LVSALYWFLPWGLPTYIIQSYIDKEGSTPIVAPEQAQGSRAKRKGIK